MTLTVVLVHGAYADSSSWNRVIGPWRPTVTAWSPGPTRCAASPPTPPSLTDLVRTSRGPWSSPATPTGAQYDQRRSRRRRHRRARLRRRVRATAGESPGDASALAPGSTLADTLERVPLADGGTDTYIAPDQFHHESRPTCRAPRARSAMIQRPVTEAALFDRPTIGRSGAPYPAGSCSASSTATFPPARTASWPSAPGRSARSSRRSFARRRRLAPEETAAAHPRGHWHPTLVRGGSVDLTRPLASTP